MKHKLRLEIGLLAILILAFTVLSVFVTSGAAQNFNDRVYSEISLVISPSVTVFMKVISNIGEWFVYIPFVLLLLMIPKSRIKVGLPAAYVLGIAAALNYLLKRLFHIDRPEAHRLIEETGYGFPSGHAMIGTAFVGICLYLFCRYSYHKYLKVIVTIITVIFLMLEGFSRIYLGVHTPTDVIAGYLCGLIIVLITVLVIRSKDLNRIS